MSNLKEINTKIKSLQNTSKITKTMKLIATNKLVKAKSDLLSSYSYYDHLNVLFKEHLKKINLKSHPYFVSKNKQSKIHLIVITSERGLCGPYNINVCKKVIELMKKDQFLNKEIKIHFFGKKGKDYLRDYENCFFKIHDASLLNRITYHSCCEVAKELLDLFASGKADAVYVAYTKFESTIKQSPMIKKVLPFEIKEKVLKDFETTQMDQENWIYEKNFSSVFEAILSYLFKSEIFNVFLNSQVSEHASRMTAMDSATKNGEELIASYTLKKNRVRQASITTELTEITSGAEALKG